MMRRARGFGALWAVTGLLSLAAFLLISLVAQAQFGPTFTPNGPWFVQGCKNYLTGGTLVASVTCTMSTGARAGSTYVLIANASLTSASPISSATDDKGDSCTVAQGVSSSNNSFGIAYCSNITAGATVITVNWASNSAYGCIEADELRNVGVIDGHAAQVQFSPGTGSNAVTSGSFTPSVNGDMVWAGSLQVGSAAGTFSAGTGFTAGLAYVVVADKSFMSENLIQATAGSIAGTFTASSSPTIVETGGMAFKPKG